MKKYKATSSHEMGYSWAIQAPAELNTTDISWLVDEFINYTDTPNQNSLLEMLRDSDFIAEVDAKRLALFQQVIVYAETAHSEGYIQDLEQV